MWKNRGKDYDIALCKLFSIIFDGFVETKVDYPQGRKTVSLRASAHTGVAIPLIFKHFRP